ncbi:MAG: Gfo/Idh/MocA family oxidoreductase [Planctomycetaceae bacterium]|nr:Gfo/Idh/MocA family oxidoreductase [Planctomycetaceae bacterium]
MKKHNIAIIGAGAIAQKHAQVLSELTNVIFAGCCDAGSGRAAQLSARFHARTYANWQAIVDDPQVDAIIVASPSGAHMEPSVAAAAAGKHVLCEKPLEITLERVNQMIAAHQAAGTRLGGIFQNRFIDAVVHLRQAIARGRFGRITYAAAAVPWWRSNEYYSGTWRGTWSLDGGGATMNQSIHMIDLLIALMGEPVEVKSFAGTLAHAIEAEDTLAAAVRFANGALGTIYATTASWPGRPKRLEITGSDGTAVLVDDRLTVWDFRDKLPEDEQVPGSASAGCSGGASNPMDIDTLYLKRNVQAFLKSVDENTPFELDAREAAKSIKLILSLYADAGLGKWKSGLFFHIAAKESRVRSTDEQEFHI